MQWLKTKFIHSISIKASLAIFTSCLIVGSIAAFIFSKYQNDYIYSVVKSEIENSASQTSNIISNHLEQLVYVGKLANHQVTVALRNKASQTTGFSLPQVTDGSYRYSKSNVGVYLAQSKTVTDKVLFESKVTSEIFSGIATNIQPLFANFFYISVNGNATAFPSGLIEGLGHDHTFTDDLFYKLGTPEFNPTRQPIWTPVYYDDIQFSWVMSLIIPIYIDNQFVGVTGSDFKVDELGQLLSDKMDLNPNKKIFVYDKKGNLILDPQLRHIQTEQKPVLNTTLNNFNTISPELQEIIRSNILSNKFIKTQTYERNESNQIVTINAIPEVDWYLGVAENLQNNPWSPSNVRFFLYLGILLSAICMGGLIYSFINTQILSRLKQISNALTQVKQGELNLSELARNCDEIGAVAKALASMSDDNQKLIQGLNLKIEEKEVAELSAIKLANAVKHSETAIAILNQDFEIEFINPKFIELTGREEYELQGAKIETVVDPQMTWVLDSAYEQLALGHAWKGELLIAHPNGDSIWVSQTFSPMTQDVQGVKHYVSATQDISFIKQSQRKMEKLAYHDPLTNLYNRTFFKAQLTKSLEMTKRGHFAFALFYFDLDKFKRINDTLGHEAGDELLVEISKRLVRRLRAEDTIARLGGDEFAVILSGVSSAERAASMAHDIQNVISEPVQLSAAEVLITTSIGITMSPRDAISIENLMRNADLAMYRAKAAGRNTHYFFTDDLDKEVQESLIIETELREAIKEQQFVLYYQPQVNLADGELFGFEALIRWNHPTKGMVSPAVFIPVAEQSGLIVALGEWVIDEASHFIARLNKEFNKNYTVAVNLSARQFKDKNIVSIIKDSITKARINSHWLDIEITESMLMGDINEALKQLDEIKSLGVQMSIDDFGTGYSSLSYLKKFPVDTLKVDRAFIRDIPDDKDDMAISDAIIAMAHKLNMQVIAEGVETAEHVEFLVRNNCQIGQGYLFSQPLPEAELFSFIKTEKIYQNLF
ncbi:EAL domain-containing protein [Catenovulum maritimum]|uniref:cyclic-guanylate-specific phosphodiesterase n=1 Tax=Catenovulum maritimum TaxID=1513271 RepID=A0A0J8GSD6_9ALTE|nr:EAL domain-containing protein [Catenovulum maritimum]KMT64209.1 hypothetical protein XM47_15695 [Catenovulum maritimum]